MAGCAEVLEKVPCPGRCGGPRDRTQTRCSTAARCKLAVVPRMRVCNHDAVSTRDIRSQAFGSALAGSAIALAITNNFESNRAINRSQPETYGPSYDRPEPVRKDPSSFIEEAKPSRRTPPNFPRAQKCRRPTPCWTRPSWRSTCPRIVRSRARRG